MAPSRYYPVVNTCYGTKDDDDLVFMKHLYLQPPFKGTAQSKHNTTHNILEALVSQFRIIHLYLIYNIFV